MELQYRTMMLERSSINEEERSIELSFSSEHPVLRRNGYEILSHRSEDADFSFIGSGAAPVLLGHDSSQQIGVVQSAGIVDGVGRAQIKFSRSGLGQEIFNDLVDGVRQNVSVGYSTSQKKLDGKIEDVNAYRYAWQPYEISIVSLPADPTIGVGRAADEETIINTDIPTATEAQMSDQNLEIPEIEATVAEQRSAEVTKTTRAANIADVTAICKRYGFEDKVEEFVTSERSLEEIKAEIIKEWSARNKATTFSQAPAIHVKQERSYSLGKAIVAASTGNWKDAGYEREQSQELAHKSERNWNEHTFHVDPNMVVRSSNTVGGVGSGAELVGTQYMPERLIDALWNKTFLGSLGTDSMLGLQGNASFPVINSNATSTFVGEVGPLPAAQSLGTALKTISPKQMVSKFEYSRQLLVQGLPNIEAKVMDQLYRSIAQKLDEVALANSGVTLSTTGLLNEITQVVSMGTNGGIPTLAAFWELQKALINSKTLQGNLAYLTSGSAFATMHTTLKDSANTASGYILADGQNTLNGYPLVWSQNVPNTLSKGTGTNLSAAILGNWSDLLVAQWGSIQVEIDPFTAADTSQYLVRSYSFWDMLIKRPESFAIIKDLKV